MKTNIDYIRQWPPSPHHLATLPQWPPPPDHLATSPHNSQRWPLQPPSPPGQGLEQQGEQQEPQTPTGLETQKRLKPWYVFFFLFFQLTNFLSY